MNVGQYLKAATGLLAQAEVESARLDVLVLLEDALHKNRASLLAHPELELSQDQVTTLDQAIAKRAKHIPLAYIRGKAEFYGREFTVNEHVLVPRPETESIIELFKQLDLRDGSTVADIGCGSGCIGVTAALEVPTVQVTLYDIDANALDVARKNAQSLNASVQCLQNDLLKSTAEQFDCILANLPYVPNDYPINRAAGFEPKLALFAGNDGLDLYRELFAQLSQVPAKFVITEALELQHTELANIAKAAGYKLVQTDGLAQLFTHV